MGKVSDEAIRRRRRRRTDDLLNAVAAHAAAGSGTELADRRQRVAVVEVRRALRRRRLAEAAIASADERAAIAVRTLADGGLAQSEVAATCGVPLWTVRRLLSLTKAAGDPAAPADDLR
jgi:DNA-directed RNA polymerase specialized sigma24 family protein